MSEIRFNELSGYSTVMEYCFKILDIFQHLNPSKINFEEMKELADPKYEYAVARMQCAIQTIKFFQLYEKHRDNIDVLSVNSESLAALLKEFKVAGESNIDLKQKDKLFRNCLAHGRYTLSMNDDGLIDVIFKDPTTKIEGKVPYIDDIEEGFNKLASIYINAYTVNEARIVENPRYIPRSTKNISKERFYKDFFSSIFKDETKRNFESDNFLNKIFSEVINYIRGYSEMSQAVQATEELKDALFQKDTSIEPQIGPLSGDELEFLKKYIDFIEKKELLPFFNKQNINNEHLKNFDNIILKKPEKLYELLKMNVDSEDYYTILTQILNAQYSKIPISEKGRCDLRWCLATIGHMNELGSKEKTGVKGIDDNINEFLKKLGINLQLINTQTRDEYLRENIKKMSYLSPIFYANMLLATAYYSIGYVKEVNNNYGSELIDFKNIDLGNLAPIFDDNNRPSIKTVDPHKKAVDNLNRTLNEKRNPLIRKIRRDIKFTDRKGKSPFDTLQELVKKNELSVDKDFFEKNDEIKRELQEIYNQISDENKEDENEKYLLESNNGTIQEKVKSYIEFFKNNEILNSNRAVSKLIENAINRLINISNNIEGLKECRAELKTLNEEIEATKSQPPYQDSSVFYDHIRNSITHSNFKIDYNELFETKDPSKIKFHLEDYAEDKGNPNAGKRKTFEIELTAGELINIVNALHEKTNLCIAHEDIHLNDLRDSNGIIRYDFTKYDSENHPITPKKVDGIRPTNQEFEESVGEDVLMQGLSSGSILDELQDSKENRVEKKE